MLGLYADSAPSDEEEEGPYVFWETKSILPPIPARPERPSHPPNSGRSDAPSPSLGCTSNGTPKPKRTTSLASLPSPSASTTLTKRPLRQRKKRKPLNGQHDASSQPLDAHTLQMVSQLAMKVNARAAGLGSPALSRSGQTRTPSTTGKGKEKAAETVKAQRVQREPLRLSQNASANTPLRPRTAARTPQTLLTLSTTSTKSTLVKASTLAGTSKPAPPPAPPTLNRASSSTVLDDDDESYFDDQDDTFELALSQLDDVGTAATSPQPEVAPPAKPAAPPPRAAPAPAARLAANPPLRSSPRLARLAATSAAAPVGGRAAAAPFRPPAPAVSRAPTPQPATLSRPSVTAPRSHPAPPARASSSAAAPPPRFVLRTSGAATRRLTAEKQREMEELARREAEALEAEMVAAGDGGWSDEDF